RAAVPHFKTDTSRFSFLVSRSNEEIIVEKVPNYYSSMGPFEELFKSGVPILNYHMVAPLPFDALLKGLYIPPRTFAKQLNELQQAQFQSGSLEKATASTSNAQRQVILSFDDGFESVFMNAMAPLAATGFRAMQFLVPHLLGRTNEWDLTLGMKQQKLMDV